MSTDSLWYKDAITYELHVRAFYDSTGDGNGDFRGLIQKLDYLQGLSVDTLWLLPFYPSPLKDDGYDIAKHEGIHPIYGTLRDFKQFLREAHDRGLRGITELPLNHTSDQHPWFQAARHAPAGSAKRNYYVWSDTNQKYQDVRVIFRDTETSNWTWDDEAKASCSAPPSSITATRSGWATTSTSATATGVRTPMQWTGDRNAGFSRADPARLYAPVIMDPVYGYQAVNVEAQERGPHPLLNWMKHIIALRRRHRVFSRGSLEFLLDLSMFKGRTPVEMLGLTPFPPIGDLPYFLTLAPYGFYWFLLRP